jgi:hypothetical protein
MLCYSNQRVDHWRRRGLPRLRVAVWKVRDPRAASLMWYLETRGSTLENRFILKADEVTLLKSVSFSRWFRVSCTLLEFIVKALVWHLEGLIIFSASFDRVAC